MWIHHLIFPPSLPFHPNHQPSKGRDGVELTTMGVVEDVVVSNYNKEHDDNDDTMILSPIQDDTNSLGRKGNSAVTSHPTTATTTTSAATSSSSLTWKQLLQQHQALYDFACYTGVIYPVHNNDCIVHGHSSSNNGVDVCNQDKNWLKFKQLCCIVTNMLVWMYFFSCFISVCFVAPQTRNNQALLRLSFAIISILVPIVTTLCGTAKLRYNIITNAELLTPKIVSSSSSRQLCEGEQSNEITGIGVNATNAGLLKMWRLIYCLAVLVITFVIIQAINSYFFVTHKSQTFPVVSMLFTIQGSINFVFYVGVFGFILIEQQISLFAVLQVQSMALSGTLTDKVYVAIGKDMKHRDGLSSLDWILAGTMLTSIVGIILIFTVLFDTGLTKTQISEFFTESGITVLHEIIILLFLLQAMLQVNGVIDELIESFPLQSLKETDEEDQETSSLLSSEKMRMRRLELFLMMREYKIGTTIWSYRPTKLQLLIQITSIITLVATSLLRLIVINVTSV